MPNAEGSDRQCVARAKELDPSLGTPTYKELKDGRKVVFAVLDEDGNVMRRRCKHFAMRGQSVCHVHGGKAAHAKKAGLRRWRESVEYGADLALERLISALEDEGNTAAADVPKLAKLLLDERNKLPADEDDPLQAIAQEIRDALKQRREDTGETEAAEDEEE